MPYFVYILRCSDNSLYIGFSNDPIQREIDHNSGKGAFTTRKKLPVKLVYSEPFNKKEDALKRERQIKGWRREKKENLIRYGHPDRSKISKIS